MQTKSSHVPSALDENAATNDMAWDNIDDIISHWTAIQATAICRGEGNSCSSSNMSENKHRNIQIWKYTFWCVLFFLRSTHSTEYLSAGSQGICSPTRYYLSFRKLEVHHQRRTQYKDSCYCRWESFLLRSLLICYRPRLQFSIKMASQSKHKSAFNHILKNVHIFIHSSIIVYFRILCGFHKTSFSSSAAWPRNWDVHHHIHLDPHSPDRGMLALIDFARLESGILTFCSLVLASSDFHLPFASWVSLMTSCLWDSWWLGRSSRSADCQWWRSYIALVVYQRLSFSFKLRADEVCNVEVGRMNLERMDWRDEARIEASKDML